MLTDTEIGQNVRHLRERMQLSQSAFAAATRTKGLHWHQPTVSRIEDGERPLRLAEAVVLAESFGFLLPNGLGLSAGIRLSIKTLEQLLQENG
jgi:transcriptional regulator with XRE-family HTH domain